MFRQASVDVDLPTEADAAMNVPSVTLATRSAKSAAVIKEVLRTVSATLRLENVSARSVQCIPSISLNEAMLSRYMLSRHTMLSRSKQVTMACDLLHSLTLFRVTQQSLLSQQC